MKKVKMPESWMNVNKAEWKRLHSLYRRLRKINTDNPRGNPVLRKYPFEIRNACGDVGVVADRLAMLNLAHVYVVTGPADAQKWLKARYNMK